MSIDSRTDKIGPSDYNNTGLMYNYEMHPKKVRFVDYYFSLPPLKQFIAEIRSRENSPKVLDLGSGLGKESSRMRTKMPKAEVVSLDISSTGTKSGKEKYNLSQVLADVSQPPFADNQFDGILCKDVLVHIPDKELFLQNVARILAPNGVFVLSSAKHAYVGLKQFTWDSDELTIVAKRFGLQLELLDTIRMKREDWYSFKDMERVFMMFRKKK